MVLLFAFIVAALVFSSIRVADHWTRGVVLRLGKFRGLKGPGIFFIFPFFESVPYLIDTRILTSPFKAEKILTADAVLVDVDAVLFWKIVDPKRATLDVADYQRAIGLASQTALRDVIGKTTIYEMLESHENLGETLQQTLGERAKSWGIQVISAEVRDVLLPVALQDAMSMRAVTMLGTGPVHVTAAQGEAGPFTANDELQYRSGITRANIIRSSGSTS
ncbi:MAG: SPFH domain-containing protein [Acidobacteriaceae bacterium]